MKNNKYEEYFSQWMYDNLPPSDLGIIIQDIDAIIQNYKTKRFMIIELKTRGNNVTKSQRAFYSMLNERLYKTNKTDGWEYVGTNLIRFEGTNFYDGNVFLNNQLTDEYKLQQFILKELGYIN